MVSRRAFFCAPATADSIVLLNSTESPPKYRLFAASAPKTMARPMSVQESRYQIANAARPRTYLAFGMSVAIVFMRIMAIFLSCCRSAWIFNRPSSTKASRCGIRGSPAMTEKESHMMVNIENGRNTIAAARSRRPAFKPSLESPERIRWSRLMALLTNSTSCDMYGARSNSESCTGSRLLGDTIEATDAATMAPKAAHEESAAMDESR
mmetsp:Transcript_16781/g.46706  ORF Transcript_16781/g.46706 Transcript_16781/m.46706 type:complete len:209 (+) Transcript_16781:284-910(+)